MIRLATNRNYSVKGSVDYVTIDQNGYFHWSGEDESLNVGFSFPVDLAFVKDFFHEVGRELDVNRLPKNYVANPYG